MTNKIVIDGIDVSECIHISNFENVLFVCEETGRKCEVSKNCCYKQLKRKEQALTEIEKLISEALDPEKTETEQSFDNLYKCLDIIKETRKEQHGHNW